MTKKLKMSELKISLYEDINLMYEGYGGLSKETRKLCAKYNRERKKLVALANDVLRSMQHDYYRQ